MTDSVLNTMDNEAARVKKIVTQRGSKVRAEEIRKGGTAMSTSYSHDTDFVSQTSLTFLVPFSGFTQLCYVLAMWNLLSIYTSSCLQLHVNVACRLTHLMFSA